MNTEIDKLLRKAPGFTPPAGLRERLIEQIPGRETASGPLVMKPASGGWLRRWWPALAPAAVSAACAVVLTAQQGKIRELKANIQTLSQATESESAQPKERATAPVDASAETEQEINRLKELAARLKGEIGQLQQLQTENVKLRAQVAAPPEMRLTADEAESLAKAKEKAMSIACVNNLKQFGLAVRTWALDNNQSNPPNVLSMSNELSTPKILVCPADTDRQVATDWSSFTMANCSYEFLVPGEKDADLEPLRVSIRCPIHGNIGLCDGSVMRSVMKEHPDWLVERDGKVYYAAPNSPNGQNISPSSRPNPATPGTPNSTAPRMTDEQAEIFRKRYGLLPQNAAAPDNSTTVTNPAGERFTIFLNNPTAEQIRALKRSLKEHGVVPADGTPTNQNP
jgi:hypothetical protein